jgi:hypothetical protein
MTKWYCEIASFLAMTNYIFSFLAFSPSIMFDSISFRHFIGNIYMEIFSKVEFYAPKVVGAILILLIGTFVSVVIYRFTIYIYERFKIARLIDKLEIDLGIEELEWDQMVNIQEKRKLHRKKLTERIRIDTLLAKSFSYYIFLVFFRFAIIVIGITEVEVFLRDLIAYIPNLFIAVIIWFFGIRFSDTVYDVIFHALEFTRQRTSKVIAMGWKIVILFFTLMLVLNYIKIVDQFIINTFFIGFVSTISIGIGLAFWLGGKDVAKEILESFKK